MIKNHKTATTILLLLACILFNQCKSVKQLSTPEEPVTRIHKFLIKPSATDSTIQAADVGHLIMYDTLVQSNKLLLFLPGTNGVPKKGPYRLFETAIQQGYQVINLSYINEQAVARICRDKNLEEDIDCTEKFRTQRVFGTQLTSLIPDKSQDGIINRFTMLLIYLKENDKKGQWEKYLDGYTPNWERITVAGQSQGGGMAAFIAKKFSVHRIITFSGGWDFSQGREIANWYASKSVTPLKRWYGVYHTEEPMAAVIAKTYEAMRIPNTQIFRLDRKIREGKKAHGEGIRNRTYKDLWLSLFASEN